jgi:GrpB-like predicted nucleotidyltransferase (UPF0157 family)
LKFFEADEYQDKVNSIFDELSKKIKAVLPNARVEHIGSSAIEGALSKGDLDLFVGVVKNEFQVSLASIKQLGFVEKEGTLRTESLCMLVTDKFNHEVAIQLVANGSEFEDFLRFKNIMQNNPDLLSEYNQLKRDAARLSEIEYRAKKSEWIEKQLKKHQLD